MTPRDCIQQNPDCVVFTIVICKLQAVPCLFLYILKLRMILHFLKLKKKMKQGRKSDAGVFSRGLLTLLFQK